MKASAIRSAAPVLALCFFALPAFGSLPGSPGATPESCNTNPVTTTGTCSIPTGPAVPAAKDSKKKPPAKKTATKKEPSTALAAIEAKYKKAGTLSAKFKQTNFTESTGATKTSEGSLQSKPPGKIRWETTSPDASLLISDGKKIWFYTPPFDPDDASEHGQLIERPAGQIEAKLAQTLVSGALTSTGFMSVERVNETHFALKPIKKIRTTVAKAVVEIDPKKLLITGVTIEHKGGNTSDIRLSDIKLGEKIDDSVFNFKIPPNTDRVEPE